MSGPKDRREIELLVEALDDDVPDDADGQEAVRRLGIDVKSWASDVRARVASANAKARKQRFAVATTAYEQDLAALAKLPNESARSKDEQQRVLRELIAQVPQSAATSVHFHKFEEATSEELAEMIRSLRHLLGEEDNE